MKEKNKLPTNKKWYMFYGKWERQNHSLGVTIVELIQQVREFRANSVK